MRREELVTVVKWLFRHFLVLLLTVLFAVDTAWADLKFIDLTHEIPTFAPLSDDPIRRLISQNLSATASLSPDFITRRFCIRPINGRQVTATLILPLS